MNFLTDTPCLSSTFSEPERLDIFKESVILLPNLLFFSSMEFVYIDNFIAL